MKKEETGRPKVAVDIFFHGELNRLLPLKKRKRQVTVQLKGKHSVKDLVESLCVPHTEVGGIFVDHRWVDFSYIVRPGDQITVFPVPSPSASGDQCQCRTKENPLFNPEPLSPRFLCDVHLWKLARRLRLLGFETQFDPRWDDAQLAEISRKQELILLTRDRGLLIRSTVKQGIYIHNTDPEKQVKEVLQRLDLYKAVVPFTRCLSCGGLLEPVTMEGEFFEKEIRPQIPPKVLEWAKEYHYCLSCRKVFWKGSHYEKLIQMIEKYTNAK
ncbi:MAG: twitching motility protein PilT [bacterium]|nr:twitching motility protein PilT [bacterium]